MLHVGVDTCQIHLWTITSWFMSIRISGKTDLNDQADHIFRLQCHCSLHFHISLKKSNRISR